MTVIPALHKIHAPKLLEKREGYDLRVRETLEGGVVALPLWVEVPLSVVHQAKKEGECFFQDTHLAGASTAPGFAQAAIEMPAPE